jgi:sulfite exporter TauE/SafE
MPNEIALIAGTAAVIGLTHTVLGPDHYLPFIVLSKAKKWSNTRTMVITFLCGIGHVLSSVVLGFAGIAMGVAVFKLEFIESLRGELAAWLLIIFGFTYFVWGIHRATRSKTHDHSHLHHAEKSHSHSHRHVADHSHIHASESGSMTPWILFTIFVFGPCEPLIPLVMYPAAKHDLTAVAIVSIVFGLATISTMMVIVSASYHGLARLPLHKLEKYSHALAGLAIFLCGGAIKFLGL